MQSTICRTRIDLLLMRCAFWSAVQDAAAKPAAAAKALATTRSGVAAATRAPEAGAAPAVLRPVAMNANMPRTRSQTKGLSMSSVLQTRSEAAVTARRPAAPAPLPDIDSGDRDNLLAVSDYVLDIHQYYRRVEPKFRVAPDYMKKQVRGGRVCDVKGSGDVQRQMQHAWVEGTQGARTAVEEACLLLPELPSPLRCHHPAGRHQREDACHPDRLAG